MSNKDWDYAGLSHYAKQHGGPEEMFKHLEKININKGIEIGKRETDEKYGIYALLVAGGVGAVCLIKNVLNKYRGKKKAEEEQEEVQSLIKAKMETLNESVKPVTVTSII